MRKIASKLPHNFLKIRKFPEAHLHTLSPTESLDPFTGLCNDPLPPGSLHIQRNAVSVESGFQGLDLPVVVSMANVSQAQGSGRRLGFE